MPPQSIRFKCVGGSNGACFCELTEEITSPEKIYVAATCPLCSVKQISCIYCGITLKLSDDVKKKRNQLKNFGRYHKNKHRDILQPPATANLLNGVTANVGVYGTNDGDNVTGVGIDNISNEVNSEEGPVDADARNDGSGDNDSDVNSEGSIHGTEGFCFSDNDDKVPCTGDEESNSTTHESHDDAKENGHCGNDQDVLSMWALHSRFNAPTNTYFRDDYEWYTQHGEAFGGLRCLVSAPFTKGLDGMLLQSC